MSYSDRDRDRRRRPMSTAFMIIVVSTLLFIAMLLTSYIAIQLWA